MGGRRRRAPGLARLGRGPGTPARGVRAVGRGGLDGRPPAPTGRRRARHRAPGACAAAYRHQAATVARVLRTLDEGALDEVLAGPELERRRAEVAGLRQQGRAVELEARLADEVMFVEVGPLRGVVYVVSSTRARYVDPTTSAPLGPFSRTEDIRLSATFERLEVGATWKLTSSRRHR